MPSPEALAEAFCRRSPALSDAEQAKLGAQLLAWVDLAREAYPTFGPEPEAWCEHLGGSLDPSNLGSLDPQRVEELYLAYAAGTGDAAAVAVLQERFAPDIDRALRRGPSEELEELRQRVWVKLLVEGPGGKPQLLAYAGRGSLQGWVRVVVSRMVIDLMRSRGSSREGLMAQDVLSDVAAVDTEPQFRILRERYGAQVRAAMYAAFDDLSTRERRLLRGRLVDGLTTDALGVMFGVHRTTAARWLDDAQARLMEATHAALREQVGAGEQTVRSLVQMVRSQVDVSVTRLLGTTETSDD